MATSPDHPELNFVQAAGFSKGRPDGPPLWIVIHDMEAGESSDRAESTALYFATGASGRSVSAHYCVDDTSVVQCVRLADVAWTVGNRPGNNRGINWELAGFARQTRPQWLDEFGLAMFGQMAPIVRADAATYGIPLRRCTIADLKAMRPGVTSHNDLRLAFGGTTHTDPGENFPWDVFLQIMNTEADMEQSERLEQATGRPTRTVGEQLADVQNLRNWLYAAADGTGDAALVKPPAAGSRAQALLAMDVKLDQILTKLDSLAVGTTAHTHTLAAGETGPAQPADP